MRRIERSTARRRVAMQATLSAFLVASVAFGATRVISTTPTGADSLLQQPPASAAPDEPAPAGTAQPTAKPKPKPEPKPEPKPAPKPEPKPTARPEPDPTEQPAEPAPDNTKDPEPAYTKEPTKPPVANGLSAEFWPYTDAVAGAPMDWKVKAYDTAGRLLRIEVLFGDGGKAVYEPAEPCGADVNVKKFFTHTYAKAGTYTGRATVTTGGCGAPTETKSLTETVKVLAEGSGNGPSAPTVTAEQVEAALAKLALHGADADGWVKKFWVDWGDGTESVVGPRPFDGCAGGAPSAWDTTASHEYAGPGTYAVKVTVMSTNCDAGQGQTTTITVSVTV